MAIIIIIRAAEAKPHLFCKLFSSLSSFESNKLVKIENSQGLSPHKKMLCVLPLLSSSLLFLTTQGVLEETNELMFEDVNSSTFGDPSHVPPDQAAEASAFLDQWKKSYVSRPEADNRSESLRVHNGNETHNTSSTLSITDTVHFVNGEIATFYGFPCIIIDNVTRGCPPTIMVQMNGTGLMVNVTLNRLRKQSVFLLLYFCARCVLRWLKAIHALNSKCPECPMQINSWMMDKE